MLTSLRSQALTRPRELSAYLAKSFDLLPRKCSREKSSGFRVAAGSQESFSEVVRVALGNAGRFAALLA